MGKRQLSHAECMAAARVAAHGLPAHSRIYGIPRGGVPVAYMLAGIVAFATVVDKPEDATVIVDDLLDSGRTMVEYQRRYPGVTTRVLFNKQRVGQSLQLAAARNGASIAASTEIMARSPESFAPWYVFPWEVSASGEDESGHDIVVRLLQFINEDPTREGLVETPARVIKAWREWTAGYGADPEAILKQFTEESADQGLVIVRGIPVVSKCEHHLADIIGTACVGYIPGGRIVGLSKLPRLVDAFARRLQVQERMTNQIANALAEVLQPRAVGVVIEAAHHCMSTRGVRVHGSDTITSAMRGVFLKDPSARAEFLSLCKGSR